VEGEDLHGLYRAELLVFPYGNGEFEKPSRWALELVLNKKWGR